MRKFKLAEKYENNEEPIGFADYIEAEDAFEAAFLVSEKNWEPGEEHIDWIVSEVGTDGSVTRLGVWRVRRTYQTHVDYISD